MNTLLKLKKDSPLAARFQFKDLLYVTLLSAIKVSFDEEEGIKYGVFEPGLDSLHDYFHDWDSADSRKNELEKALAELVNEELIFFDSTDPDILYVGEFRGRRFFPFEKENSLYDEALEKLNTTISNYQKSKSAKDRSRGKYIREQVDRLLDKGLSNFSPSDYTDLHGFLYEIYTGGEIYILRNKTEFFQTNNILKAYDKATTFAIVVEGTLNYEAYRKKGIPTITNVAFIKDEIFKALTKGSGSKDYMRDMVTTITDDSDF